MAALSRYSTFPRLMTTLREPFASSPVTSVANSDRDGYMSRAGPACTTTTSPDCSLVTFIEMLRYGSRPAVSRAALRSASPARPGPG